jgi:hypothetical protein
MPFVLMNANGTSREVGFAPLEEYSCSVNRKHFQTRIPHGLRILLGCTGYISYELLVTERIVRHAIRWLVTVEIRFDPRPVEVQFVVSIDFSPSNRITK